jgi:3-oxoacyl-[acyl-carrier protein] reductase
MANGQSESDAPIAGRVAAVTGAASGMGRVMARALAGAGADIAAIDINADGLKALGAEPLFANRRLKSIPADVSRLPDCRAAVERTVASLGSIDVLINCAGVSMMPAVPPGKTHPIKFYEADPEAWAHIMEINAIGAFYMAHAAAPHMMKKGWGRIVNVTTSYDTMIRENMSAYGASKSSLEASTVIWSKELAGTGVTVNVLVPGGATDTAFLDPVMRRGGELPPEVMEAPIQWLASEASAGYSGYRFVGRDWDKTVPPDVAAKKNGEPAAWNEQANRATAARGEGKV